MALTQTKCFTNAKPLVLPDDAAPDWAAIDIEFSSVTYAVGDLIELATLPIGVRVVDWAFVPADIDTNASPVIAFSLGVENAGGTDLGTEVWATGLTAGTTALTRATTNIASQGVVSTERKIALKCTTAAATYAGTGKVGQLLLLLQC